MPKSATTFLMFEDQAAAAIELYRTAFPSAVFNIEHYAENAGAMAGKVLRGEMQLCGQYFILFDSPAHHAFNFTPSISVFLEAKDEEEFNEMFGVLSEDGKVMMPPANHGFSQKFAWCADKFGVSWQINLT